ncbi:MAG: PKD domain-containing protein [Candidatus Vogelbacteria bacterium]|nr:PKD domain-containing protein [Candidatus Vogelbacteria bacterium]
MKNHNFLAIILLVLGLILLTPAQAEETAEILESEQATAAALAASITAPANNAIVPVGQPITFSAAASGGEPPYAYTWDFGDGTQAFGQNYEKSYTSAGAKTVTLTVTDFAGRQATANISLTVTAPPPPPPPPPDERLAISNIRVTDVTHESAVIRWTTNKPATSRVIYDTVSHPDLAGQSAPNFGYGFSTTETDTDPKVTEHVVTVSGLSPSTTYYFRVISQ